MTKNAIKKTAILPRIQGIQEALEYLHETKKMPFKRFSKNPYFGNANFQLHNILEGIFNIGNHILSRIPGAARNIITYGDIAENLGKYGIVPKNFADDTLKKMARYRNRLVHGYARITAKETYDILNNNLKDIEEFLTYIKAVIKNPKKFKLTIED